MLGFVLQAFHQIAIAWMPSPPIISFSYCDDREHTVKNPLQADGDKLDDVLDCEGHYGKSQEYYIPAYSRLLWHFIRQVWTVYIPIKPVLCDSYIDLHSNEQLY